MREPSTLPPAVLMLTPRMTMGYGVSEAVAMQVRGLADVGVPAVVGCLQNDEYYANVPTVRVPPDAAAVADLAGDVGATVLIAHGSPYFEVLPELTGPFLTIAYEYGDPPPDVFEDEAEVATRAAVVRYKREVVYPSVSGVAVISEFIRSDIGWPDARVIVLGIEQVPDLGPKRQDAGPPGRLRVGCLMRLGPGEARYKGVDRLRDLAASTPDLDWVFAGRGTEDEAVALRQSGIRVLVNPSDAQRIRFLRELDVFVTLSGWEGTNLPMVEAEALGTPALALATGAHPEFTPFTFATAADMADQLRHYASDRALLYRAGATCYRWVRESMSWPVTVDGLLQMCAGAPREPPPTRSLWRRRWAKADRFRRALRDSGWRETLRDQQRRRFG